MPKRLIVCCDGTWNKVEKAKGGKHLSTNVAKFAAAILPTDAGGNNLQLLCYLEGVGTHDGEWVRGGMFGLGISRNIQRAYEFLVKVYELGDEIWIFGFSRGAFTARSLSGMIRDCGLLKCAHIDQVTNAMALYRDRYGDTAPDAPRARIFRNTYSHEPPIKFIGVWMIEKARRHGLNFSDDFLSDPDWFAPDKNAPRHDSFDFPFSWLDTLRRKKGDRVFKEKSANTFETIHESVVDRFESGNDDSLPPSFLAELQRYRGRS